ncbi:NAD(P)-dependent oxidoreductase [Paraburkholderia sp. MM5477-R1]|uniref:NAD(P)-dependent oxidoreductase n=1 Tax=Paraburkholderia sp. MM5477-R1 TaxID=2991062 RepID=UPI003D1CD738
MTRIFLTHSPNALKNYYGERALAQLRTLGEVTLNSQARPLAPEELVRAAARHDIVVSSRDVAAPASLFEHLPELLAFCRVAVDIRNIDVTAASHHGVLVTRATPGFDASVAEWIVGVMIDLSRGISAAVSAYREGCVPAIQMGIELRGATLGVVGYGFIGRRLGALGLALGMSVMVCDPFAPAIESGVEHASFDEVMARANFVVCLAPATPETADLFDTAAFARMRPDAYFVNASRGELVDEEALIHALNSGVIAGAALDVGCAPDQMPSPALACHPKVVATPHVGGLTPQAIEHQAFDTVRQIRSLLAGTVPDGAVNAEHAVRIGRLPGFRGLLDGAHS